MPKNVAKVEVTLTSQQLRDAVQVALADFAGWSLQRFFEMDHGCLTGDCPHAYQSQCARSLVGDFLHEERSVPQPDSG